MMNRSPRAVRSVLLALLLGNLLPALAVTPALADDFVVTSSADSGAGTLRDAITSSNATSGADTITFEIGTGPQTISLSSPLPVIGDGGLTIDGTTQDGFAAAPIIRIDGATLTGAGQVGLDIQTQLGAVVVKGLVITNFPSHGIDVSNGGTLPPGVTIQGNYIGTDGTADLGNARLQAADGIHVQGRSATIGGTSAADRNVISGNGDALNQSSGIQLAGGIGGSVVQGNYIGLTSDGVSALGQTFGVTIQQNGATIGGTAAGAGNVISGNEHSGINLTGPNSTNAVIEGNYIGTNANGIGAVENTQNAVLLNLAGTGTTIGGASAGSGNVITGGNNGDILVTGTSGTTIQGNSIGVNATESSPLGLTVTGIWLAAGDSSGMAVANTTIEDNVIGGSTDSGILIDSSTSVGGSESSNNDIVGNFIGTDRAGTADLGNGGAGIDVTGPMTDVNRIGALANGNVIANNGGDGVAVAATSRLVRIRGNEIRDNGGLGIDLADAGDPSDGVTPNDATDADAGANDLLNTPTLADVVQNGADVDYSGSLDTAPNTDVDVDVYESSDCDLSGSGEGATHVASDTVNSGAGGTDPFVISAPGTVTDGASYTATATDTSGNTSEFSTCFTASSGGGSADLGVSIVEIDSPVTAGQSSGFFAEYSNDGPDTATGAQLVIDFANDVDQITTDPSVVGVTCDAPTAGNDVTCHLGDLANTEGGVVTVGFRTPTTPGTTPVSVSVSSSTTDGNPANDSDTAQVDLTDASPGFAPSTSYPLAGTGAHSILTGLFNGDAHRDVVVTSPDDASASILLGSASGALADGTAIPLAGSPRWIAAGSLDAGNSLDLLVNTEVCTGGSPVGCGSLRFVPGNGDGTFGSPVTVDVSNGPRELALRDVDGDGELDLLTADDLGAKFSVALGNGDGSFAPATTYGAGGGQYGIDVADLDGDGELDAVTAGGTSLTVFIGNGDGTFGSATVFPTDSTSSTPTVSLTDLDGDGSPDAVIGGNVRVLVGAGDGTFLAPSEELATDAASIVTGDFNGDGEVDVEAAADGATPPDPDLLQLRGLGDATFVSGPTALLQYRVAGSLAAADLDGDGTSDLIAPNGDDDRVTVLLSTTEPAISGVTISHGPNDTVQAGFASIATGTLDFAGLDLTEGTVETSAGPLSAPIPSKPIPSKPIPSKPIPSKPIPSKPIPSKGVGAAAPLSQAPLSSLIAHDIPNPPLLTQIGVDLDGGWPVLLEGTSFEGVPLQNVNFNQVSRLPAVAVIKLSHFDFSQTAIGSLPPAAFLYGETPLSDIGLPTGTWEGLLTQIWGTTEATQFCADPISRTDLSQTLVDLALARCPIAIAPWSTMPLTDVDLTAAKAPLHSFLFTGIDVTKVHYTLGGNEVALGDLTLDQVPAGVVNCSELPCTAANTLADAQDQDTFQPTASFGDLFAGGAAVLGDMTLGDLLLGIVQKDGFPYENVSLQNLLAAAEPGNAGAVPYTVAFDITCPAPVDTEIRIQLPTAGFGYVRGTSEFSFDGGPAVDAGDPDETASGVLSWTLPSSGVCTGAAAHVQLTFRAQPAPTVGSFIGSARIVTSAGDSTKVDDDPLTLTPANEPNDSVATAMPVTPDTLYTGGFSTPSDVDYFEVPVGPGDIGSLVTVYLSHMTTDDDLVLYGSAADDLSSKPIPSKPIPSKSVGDQEGCLPTGYVLQPQTLDNVPQVSTSSVAVRGFSTNRSDQEEVVCTSVTVADIAAGHLTFQVSHNSGPVDGDTYVVRYIKEQDENDASCAGPDFTFDGEGQTYGPGTYSKTVLAGSTVPANTKTLFLINEDRFGDLYGSFELQATLAKLQALALDQQGAIIPVESNSTGAGNVAAAYATLNVPANQCSPEAANAVVKSINKLVGTMTVGASPQYVVIVGSDDVIPFARLQDLTTLGNQVAYSDNLRFDNQGNPESRAFARGMFLSDDPYGTLSPAPWVGNLVYLPDMSVGRLVETPTEIQDQIQGFLDRGGVIDPKTAMVTGTDFSQDVAGQILTTLNGRAGDLNGQPGPDDYGSTSLINNTWSRAQAICRLNGSNLNTGCDTVLPPQTFIPPGLISVNGHFDHFRTLPGQANTSDLLSTTDFLATRAKDGTLLFTIGCNSGVSVPDGYVTGGGPAATDWAQALAQKHGSLVANNGYGYGDTTRIAYSERLMRLFADNLDGGFTIGDALREAKVSYWLELATYSPYDVKSLEQSTFYGLPMYEITGTGTPGGSAAPQIRHDPATNLQSADVKLPTGSDTHFVHPVDDLRTVPGVGQFYVGPRTQVTTGYPIEPISNPIPMTAPPSQNLRLHGAIVTELRKQDFDGFDPVVGSTQLNGAAAGTEPKIAVGISPTDFLTTSFAGGRDSLVMYGGQFTANLATPGLGRQRIYTEMAARGFYAPSSSTDFTPPDVATNSGQLLPGGFATFSTTTNADDAVAAYALYLPTGSNTFKLLQLSPQGSTPFKTFQGTVSAPAGVSQFAVQIVDDDGNVAIDTFKGASLPVQTAPTPPANIVPSIIVPPGTAKHGQWYDGPVTVRITTTSFNAIAARLDGGTPSFTYNVVNVPVPGTDGVHRVDYTVGTFSSTVFVPIDKGPPVVSHIIGDTKYEAGSDLPYVSAGATLTINVADPSGLASCTIRVTGPNSYDDSTPCLEGDTSITLPSTDGTYTIRTTATDNASNTVVDSDQFTATRDGTPPTITPGVVGPQFPTFTGTNDNIYVRSDTSLTMKVEDVPGAGANSSASGVRDCSTTLTDVLSPGCFAGLNTYFAVGDDGPKTLSTTATDNVSNQATRNLHVILDNTPPTIVRGFPGTAGAGDDGVYTSGGTTWVRSDANLDVSVTDNGSGIATCSVATSAGAIENAPPAAPGAGCSAGDTHYRLKGADSARTVTIQARDRVTNESQSTIDATVDNTAPIFASCPTPNPGVSGRLATGITLSQTAFTVNEIATPPHVQFIATVDPGTATEETMLVTKRKLVGSSVSQASYTVTRGYAGTSKFTHPANAPIAWSLLARQDLLGTPTVTLANAATATTLKLTGQRFGLPTAPFLVMVDHEQMLVTSVVTTGTGAYDLTVVRKYNGTVLASHATTARVMWSGESYGVVVGSVSATAQTFTVKEGRFGPPVTTPFRPFEINVGAERLTVVKRVASGTNFTYTVARAVDGTKAVSHSANDAVWTTPTTAVYLHSPSQVLSVPVTDDVVTGVTGSGIHLPSFSLSSGSPAVTAGTFAGGKYSFTLNPNGSSVGVATFPVSISVRDNVGNASTPLLSVTGATTNPPALRCWYEITYAFSGFASPVDNDSLNSENSGSSTPLKWRITDYGGAGVTDPATFVAVTASASKTCDTTPEFTVTDQQFKGGSNLQNQGNGLWQFNWSLPSSYKNSCRTVAVRLASSGLTNPLPIPGTSTIPAPSRRYEYTNVKVK